MTFWNVSLVYNSVDFANSSQLHVRYKWLWAAHVHIVITNWLIVGALLITYHYIQPLCSLCKRADPLRSKPLSIISGIHHMRFVSLHIGPCLKHLCDSVSRVRMVEQLLTFRVWHYSCVYHMINYMYILTPIVKKIIEDIEMWM